MAELVVVTGPPGSGKTTVGRRLAYTFERSVLVEGDEFFGFLAAGAIEPWLPNTEAQNDVVWPAASRPLSMSTATLPKPTSIRATCWLIHRMT